MALTDWPKPDPNCLLQVEVAQADSADDRGELKNAASLPLPEEGGLPAAPVAPQQGPAQQASELDEEVLDTLTYLRT